MSKKKKKIFVIDTNVLLHDYKCIFNFQENDVIIPITVLEELDKFKKGNDLINFHAREFTRELDRLSGDGLFNGGISLGEGLGKLSIETGKVFSGKMNASFPENTPDHRILAIAEHIYLNNKDRDVVLVTKLQKRFKVGQKTFGVLFVDDDLQPHTDAIDSGPGSVPEFPIDDFRVELVPQHHVVLGVGGYVVRSVDGRIVNVLPAERRLGLCQRGSSDQAQRYCDNWDHDAPYLRVGDLHLLHNIT